VLHEIFSEYGYLEDIFMFKEFALVQFQHVRHAILALFRHNGTRVYENCCVMDIRLIDLSLSYKCSTILRVLLIPSILQNEIQLITRNC